MMTECVVVAPDGVLASFIAAVYMRLIQRVECVVHRGLQLPLAFDAVPLSLHLLV